MPPVWPNIEAVGLSLLCFINMLWYARHTEMGTDYANKDRKNAENPIVLFTPAHVIFLSV